MFFGIRGRLVFTYLLVIALTVGAIEALAFWAVREYYLGNIRTLLETRAANASNFYRGYLSNTAITDNTGILIDNFGDRRLQLQITDTRGKVLADSLHATYGRALDSADIREALTGRPGSFSGKDPKTGERIMAVASPLSGRNGMAGAVRFAVSLENTYRVISSIEIYFLLVGSGIILLVFVISIYISRTITGPVKKITLLSKEIAGGNLSVRAERVWHDEIGIFSDSLNHMAEELQKTDRLKSEFISSVTHELKTPLTSIKGWAVTLGDTGSEDMEILRRGIYIINSETDRLTEMVEELLDFSRLNSGGFSLTREPAVITRLLTEVAEQMKPRAQRQGIRLEVHLTGEEAVLQMDERRIRQVLVNLLDNSLKFTPNGGRIEVIGSTGVMEPGSFYEITVRDTGCGIAEEELPLLRNRFYRGSNSGSTGGIGLGLSICDELVRAHNGRLEMRSGVGKGTEVTVLLPL